MIDVNVYQENIFHTKMHVKEFDLDTYLFEEQGEEPVVQGAHEASKRGSSAKSRSCTTAATWSIDALRACDKAGIAGQGLENPASAEVLALVQIRYATAFIDPRRTGHQLRDRRRQPARAVRFGVLGMADLVGFHDLQDGAAAKVFRRQAVEVFVQVRLDLAFGFDDEAQVPAIARRPAPRPMA